MTQHTCDFCGSSCDEGNSIVATGGTYKLKLTGKQHSINLEISGLNEDIDMCRACENFMRKALLAMKNGRRWE